MMRKKVKRKMKNSDFDENDEAMLHNPRGVGFKKILVVDDIMYVVKSISRILRSEGYFVITAMTGKEAIKKFDKYKPDLITMDQILPDMTGLQLVGKLKERGGGEKVKIIFVSAVQGKDEIKSIIGTGISNYILKPFKKENLIAIVKNLIG
ncbi:MAG: response regulator [Spirochaetales bacterium]|nr:response regulator [Spirochaetales bacterium]